MEVVFLDVGQGTCQVIFLGKGRAIVIDTGTMSKDLVLNFLQRNFVETIVALITTHSDNDHLGGATSILGHYRDRVELVGFVKDHKFFRTNYWTTYKLLERDGSLSEENLVRLEFCPDRLDLWTDAAGDAFLQVASPSAFENLVAEEEKDSNATSAVLVLGKGQHRVVFAADSTIGQWRAINKRLGGPQRADVLAVPHHGGLVGADGPDDLAWLYSEGIDVRHAIISVGSNNTYDHPNGDVVDALRAASATVQCTQITPLCHGNIEQLRPSVLPSTALFGASARRHVAIRLRRPRAKKKNSTVAGPSNKRPADIACAGSILVDLSGPTIRIHELVEHQRSVDELDGSVLGRPRCRHCV